MGRIKVDWRPVSNAEILVLWQEGNLVQIPCSWVEVEGDMVRCAGPFLGLQNTFDGETGPCAIWSYLDGTRAALARPRSVR
jgi:hypothetical protein